MYASSGNKYFFTKSCHRQTYQNYEHPHQTSQHLYFQSRFSVLKIGQIFPKNFSYEKYLTRRPTFIKHFLGGILTFKVLYILKLRPIIVGSVHYFGKSDNDKI
jgi:hypothetical protein